MTRIAVNVTIADEVWIATALLHREHPEAEDFTLADIEARLRRENIAGSVRPGVRPHISVHTVGNRAPSPARYRLLFETARSRRRLFRPGDRAERGRTGKTTPFPQDLPPEYRPLLEWYERDWLGQAEADPLLALAARHRQVWRGVSPDDYVRELREGGT